MLRNLRRKASGREGGFTLVEMTVAMTVVALAAAGTVPLLVVGMRAAAASRLHTQAKNLSQQRLESMRDLQFHVDRQNGPFVDLLDVYYTNLSASQSTRTRANEVQVGNWISGGAAAPAPAGPFYQLNVASLPGSGNFSQIVDTQFLDATGHALPATTFTGYDSQIEGRDQPATLMVGVTVITSWTYLGVGHSYATYSRIADVRGQVSSLTTQGIGEYLRVSSTGAAGNALTVDVASAEASGSPVRRPRFAVPCATPLSNRCPKAARTASTSRRRRGPSTRRTAPSQATRCRVRTACRTRRSPSTRSPSPLRRVPSPTRRQRVPRPVGASTSTRAGPRWPGASWCTAPARPTRSTSKA